MRHILGVIGGSGLYGLEGLQEVEEVSVTTPFGPPSGPLVRGRLGDCELVFLARHGENHTLLPSEVPYRANIYALKSLGVGWLVSLSAVGSLRESIRPGDFIVVDQYIDRTRGRGDTFFGQGCVAHVSFGDPVCSTLSGLALSASQSVGGGETHEGGVYVCIEGPAFSTRAESEMYRGLGADVVGMTNLPEAKLAREAEMSYATLAMATDYDCWRTEGEQVNVEGVLRTLRDNAERAKGVVAVLARALSSHDGPPPCGQALEEALLTPRDAISEKARARLGVLLDRVLS